jgi:hypothetical protein
VQTEHRAGYWVGDDGRAEISTLQINKTQFLKEKYKITLLQFWSSIWWSD